MSQSGPAGWPPPPIRTGRLILRESEALGFTEVERFEEYGAEQWFGVWSLITPCG